MRVRSLEQVSVDHHQRLGRPEAIVLPDQAVSGGAEADREVAVEAAAAGALGAEVSDAIADDDGLYRWRVAAGAVRHDVGAPRYVPRAVDRIHRPGARLVDTVDVPEVAAHQDLGVIGVHRQSRDGVVQDRRPWLQVPRGIYSADIRPGLNAGRRPGSAELIETAARVDFLSVR